MISFSKQKNIHPCHLDIHDLGKLIDAVKTDIDENVSDSNFTIRTNHDGLNIIEHSLEDFLKNNKLPKIINDLSIDITSWSDNKIIQRISIALRESHISLDVMGNSEIWVNGKLAQIEEILLKTRPKLWFLQLNLFAGGFSGITSMVAIFGLGLIFKEILSGGLKSANMGIVFLVITMSLLNWAIVSQKYAKIFIEPKIRSDEKYKDWLTILAVLGSVASIISIFMK